MLTGNQCGRSIGTPAFSNPSRSSFSCRFSAQAGVMNWIWSLSTWPISLSPSSSHSRGCRAMNSIFSPSSSRTRSDRAQKSILAMLGQAPEQVQNRTAFFLGVDSSAMRATPFYRKGGISNVGTTVRRATW